MEIWVDENPQWLKWIAPNGFEDSDLYRIVIFYVFHSPCPGLSAMGKSLEEYGWKTPWRQPFSLKRQLKQAASNYDLLYAVDKYKKFEENLVASDLMENFPSTFQKERICFYHNKGAQFVSVFYHIRNAFAHGRLNIVEADNECFFVLEDVLPPSKNGEKKLSARMIIKKQTLLNWIEIIEGGERHYRKDNLYEQTTT